MATSFGALCTDFYINMKLGLKMDLPADRETILHLFDRVRKTVPSMERFRRYDDELALESGRQDGDYRWLALRRNSIRTGYVNPRTMAEGYQFHQMILELTPYNLTISPLDVDCLELMFGFDLECKQNHDEIVYEALMSNGPMANMLKLPEFPDAHILDVQPVFGMSLNKSGDLQAYFEVKTRAKSRKGRASRYRHEPISLFVTVRQYGPIDQIDDLTRTLHVLANHAEHLATERLVPDLLTPIARLITSSSP